MQSVARRSPARRPQQFGGRFGAGVAPASARRAVMVSARTSTASRALSSAVTGTSAARTTSPAYGTTSRVRGSTRKCSSPTPTSGAEGRNSLESAMEVALRAVP
ncbi:hypothetical protein [Streptomyces sp. NPDC059802]|uniref:hypothetical protein n=1 Tax=Streptomyces sp. NPDC059802 TaxID=3346952 RepID=UPI003650073D